MLHKKLSLPITFCFLLLRASTKIRTINCPFSMTCNFLCSLSVENLLKVRKLLPTSEWCRRRVSRDNCQDPSPWGQQTRISLQPSSQLHPPHPPCWWNISLIFCPRLSLHGQSPISLNRNRFPNKIDWFWSFTSVSFGKPPLEASLLWTCNQDEEAILHTRHPTYKGETRSEK